MISARITLAFDIYCKKKHRALELQRGLKTQVETKSHDPVLSALQSLPLKPEQLHAQ